MAYNIENGLWRQVFAFPSEIVDSHLKMCGKTQLKVLLALLRHNGDLGVSALASMTGEKEPDVRDAIEYWAALGVLQSGEAKAPALEYTRVEAPEPATASAKPEKPARKVETITGTRRRFDRDDIARLAEQDENLAGLFQEAQSVLGRVLSAVDTDTVAALYSYYGMKPDVIMMLLHYCAGLGRSNMRYIEKVAASWIESGIETHEQADAEIRRKTEQRAVENRVKSAFGIYDRSLVPREKAFIERWVNELNFDVPMISLAFERCVEATAKLSFSYINGILSNWSEKGIKSPADAVREVKPESPRRKTAAAKPSSYDLGELEQLLEQGSF